jgi:thiosulfate/3-mercaptopyruvate sulfurtransferase
MDPIPVAERGYANHQFPVETSWLAKHLTDQNVRVIDARNLEQFEAGHVPGAVNLSGFGGIPRALNGDMADPDDFADLAGSLGISNDMTVIVYDTPSQMMGTVAWAFLYYGQTDVRMLDGGFHKWLHEGHPSTVDIAHYPRALFIPQPLEAIYSSLDHARDAFREPNTIFWDTRSLSEYRGAASVGRQPSRLGRIPGAIHLDWTELFDPDSKTLKPARQLYDLLISRGISPEYEINTY